MTTCQSLYSWVKMIEEVNCNMKSVADQTWTNVCKQKTCGLSGNQVKLKMAAQSRGPQI